MDRNLILNAMEKKARTIFKEDEAYGETGKRGMMVVEMRDPKNPEQWDSSCRSFGIVFRDYQYEGEQVISNGTNFDALVRGKIAFTRRTGKDSGTNYYQVLGYESFWKGSILSDDGVCICAFAGFKGDDDARIAKAGIICYESLKREEEAQSAVENQTEEEPQSEDETAG
jgi:hypothetical protein